MEKLLSIKAVQESLELLSIATSKQDVIYVEYDVLSILGELQSSSEILADTPERNLLFAEARLELVNIIQSKMAEFVVKKASKRKKDEFSITKPVINKKAYKKPKYRNYLQMIDDVAIDID